jgi:hypothetical protein
MTDTMKIAKRLFAAPLLLAALLVAGAAAAGQLGSPTDRPILTISDTIEATNKDDSAQFDRAMLEGLGIVRIETKTPWYNDAVKFDGVRFDALTGHGGRKQAARGGHRAE